MTADDERLDASVVAALYVQHSAELERFLVGVLRDRDLAGDVLHVTFAKLIERGERTRIESRKAWLFRVAYHEALAVRRRQGTARRALRQLARDRLTSSDSADRPLLRSETVKAVRDALELLPVEQRQVVRKRLYEDKTFAVIAQELQIPLGTALGRMRSAITKLRLALEPPD